MTKGMKVNEGGLPSLKNTSSFRFNVIFNNGSIQKNQFKLFRSEQPTAKIDAEQRTLILKTIKN